MEKVSWCRYCSAEITFNPLIINERTGNKLALNCKDSSIHKCRLQPVNEERRISECIRYLGYINSNLKTAQLRLIREPKE